MPQRGFSTIIGLSTKTEGIVETADRPLPRWDISVLNRQNEVETALVYICKMNLLFMVGEKIFYIT